MFGPIDYCHACHEWSELKDGVYCEPCLEAFYHNQEASRDLD